MAPSYADILRAVEQGALVACVPCVRGGKPMVMVHATHAHYGQLPYVCSPLARVRAGFALGHICDVRRECAARGIAVAA